MRRRDWIPNNFVARAIGNSRKLSFEGRESRWKIHRTRTSGSGHFFAVAAWSLLEERSIRDQWSQIADFGPDRLRGARSRGSGTRTSPFRSGSDLWL